MHRASDHKMSLITANTSNTLTVNFYTSSGSGVTWNVGDKFEIHRPLITLDQPGRGECADKVTTDSKSAYSINQTTGRQSWPHQKLEPWVCWNDKYLPNGTYLTLSTTGGTQFRMRPGVDLINGTASMPSVMAGYTPYIYPHPLTHGPAITSRPRSSRP